MRSLQHLHQPSLPLTTKTTPPDSQFPPTSLSSNDQERKTIAPLAIAALTIKIDNLSDNVNELTSNVNTVLARSAVLDDVLLELRDSHEQHQRNFEQHQRHFEEHQRTTNAALQSLEAILLQLTRINPQN